ncbi:phosphopantetheine-binding protein [Nonomuraea sp. NPDC050547]|uniref:phosphopantetheine-binding protein n=1 Tax=unclassified Nonomuraea TaxID=2593643 RepID=UPI00346F7DF5
MSETARRLRAQVAELLYVEPEEIGPDDDLLAAGMDSIRLMTLAERWRAEGAEVSFPDLVERPTLTAWAELLA